MKMLLAITLISSLAAVGVAQGGPRGSRVQRVQRPASQLITPMGPVSIARGSPLYEQSRSGPSLTQDYTAPMGRYRYYFGPRLYWYYGYFGWNPCYYYYAAPCYPTYY